MKPRSFGLVDTLTHLEGEALALVEKTRALRGLAISFEGRMRPAWGWEGSLSRRFPGERVTRKRRGESS